MGNEYCPKCELHLPTCMHQIEKKREAAEALIRINSMSFSLDFPLLTSLSQKITLPQHVLTSTVTNIMKCPVSVGMFAIQEYFYLCFIISPWALYLAKLYILCTCLPCTNLLGLCLYVSPKEWNKKKIQRCIDMENTKMHAAQYRLLFKAVYSIMNSEDFKVW